MDAIAPLTVSCWPSAGSAASTVVTLEYVRQMTDVDLSNLVVRVPLGSAKTAPVVQRSDGDYRFDARSRTLEWSVAAIDDDSNEGSIEFVVANLGSPADLFPIEVSFQGDFTVCSISPLEVATMDGTPVDFSKTCSITAENYQVLNEAD